MVSKSFQCIIPFFFLSLNDKIDRVGSMVVMYSVYTPYKSINYKKQRQQLTEKDPE